jgi:predicted unusual protein kinase regulating ubiquinone biosynthesis (AarF/ABC1/UbiB family)
VLVTEWIDGDAFAAVTAASDAVRDRYAQIVYRFFYATVRELGLALGDPHPGNYLLCPDGRVAFFDFGMMRRLPPDYLTREARILRAVRESDAAGIVEAMHDLGYLPGAREEWDAPLLLEYMRRASWWIRTDGPLRLSPEDLWRSTQELRDDGAAEHFAQLRRMTLPREALLLRRMEGLLFQTASTLRARADWGPLLAELIEGASPVGELGAAHAHWLAHR